jgi:hypothetical protein
MTDSYGQRESVPSQDAPTGNLRLTLPTALPLWLLLITNDEESANHTDNRNA